MDRGKVRGDYASAYKLSSSTSTVDKKTLRVHRRSIEQRELRHETHNKRRPLVDLSPVQEGDMSNVNKSYKDKTPVKPKDKNSQKGFERLEQLMKWKKEREMKRKMESKSKTNPVFRVSKNMDYKELSLFKAPSSSASKPQTKKPVKAAAIPVSKPIVSSQPSKRPTQPAATRASKPAQPVTSTATSRKRRNSGNQATKKTVPETLPSRSRLRASPVSKRQKTASAPVKAAPVPTRTTRQSARNQAAQAKSTKEPAAATKSSAPEQADLPNPTADFSKVTRDRGLSTDSFAPPDFSFNVSSFVFKPLSPSSAAGFLYPGQDNSCTSFLESNPKRASTPKKDKDARRSPNDVATVTDKCSDTVMLDNTAINMKALNETNAETTIIASQEEKPATRRSTRQSRSASAQSRKSSSQRDASVEKRANKTVAAPESATRRSTRSTSTRATCASQHSVTDSGLASDDSNITKDTDTTMRRRGRSRGRKSSKGNVSVKELNKTTKQDTEEKNSEDTVDNPVEKLQDEVADQNPVSKQESVFQAESTESSSDEVFVKTPQPAPRRKSVRKSIRLSITASTETPDSNAVNQEVETPKTVNIRAADTPKSVLKKEPKSERKVKHVTLSIDNDEEDTPRRSARHARRSMPAAQEKVKPSKRNQRKSMLPRMPKSPEEWVEFLSNSPMIEMTRRTPKNVNNVTVPALNFDELDLEQPNFEEDRTDSGVAMATETSETAPAAATASPDQVEQVVSPSKAVVEEAAVSTSEADANTEDEMNTVVQKAPSTEAMETVQVGEITSTQGPSEDCSSEEHDVPYFRNLVTRETNRLNSMSSHWDEINSANSLTEDVQGQIRTTIGQAQLLIAQRFKQFIGLVDNCEFKTGEKETTCTDLQGFWDMIYFQVEDVDAKFKGLAKLQENNWVEEKPAEAKKIKKKVAKPSVTKPVVKSKFAAFRAKMKKKASSPGATPAAQEEEEEKVFEIPGFFKVASPVRKPKFHCEAGTPKKAAPASVTSAVEKPAPGSSKSDQSQPNSAELPMFRLHARKSYVPLVPSPLLVDSTPTPRPTRSCTQTPAAPETSKSEDGISRDIETGESASKRIKTTPVRRSLRPRKSVNFAEEEEEVDAVGSPGGIVGFDPVSESQSPTCAGPDDVLNVSDNSFAKYLQPSNSSMTGSNRKSGRPSLKTTPSSQRRKSRRSVHFSSPARDDLKHMKMPRTPFNRDSMVKQKRVTRRSVSEVEEEDIFSMDNIDNDENTPPPPASFRSPRPSLLFTPPEKKRSPKVNTNVPTATLISFTP